MSSDLIQQGIMVYREWCTAHKRSLRHHSNSNQPTQQVDPFRPSCRPTM